MKLTMCSRTNVFAFALLVTTAAHARAQAEFKLLPSDGTYLDYVGASVSADGDTAVVGAWGNDDSGAESGSAYVFVRDGTIWTEQTKLLASDGADTDYFGFAVSMSADTVVVGAPFGDDDDDYSGSAYVFVRNGTTWTQQAELLASDGVDGDRFGYSVSVDGDTAVVGAYFDDENGSYSGSAYVFVRKGTTWTEEAKLLPSTGAVEDYFGLSVSVNGETAVIGASLDDEIGFNSGAAYVFVRNGTTWTEQAKLLASDGVFGDYFGHSVSLSGETAIVSSIHDYGSYLGSAYVFVRSGTAWTEQAKLVASDGTAGDYFGYAVAVSGDMVIVGAIGNDDQGSSSGSAYVFVRSGASWTQYAKLLASDGAAFDSFGSSVSVSGDVPLVGAYEDDGQSGPNYGSAYVFMLADCNNNGIADGQDITSGTSQDCDANYVPDECQIADGPSLDLNANGILDSCECFVSTYCIANPNSTNLPGQIAATGIPSLSLNSFALRASQLPPGQHGVFFFGPLQIAPFPFGDGYRCVGGQLVRLNPPVQADSQGTVQRALDFTLPPTNGFSAGDTRNFQFWYRDPQAVGVGFNLTDALEVAFCP